MGERFSDPPAFAGPKRASSTSEAGADLTLQKRSWPGSIDIAASRQAVEKVCLTAFGLGRRPCSASGARMADVDDTSAQSNTVAWDVLVVDNTLGFGQAHPVSRIEAAEIAELASKKQPPGMASAEVADWDCKKCCTQHGVEPSPWHSC